MSGTTVHNQAIDCGQIGLLANHHQESYRRKQVARER